MAKRNGTEMSFQEKFRDRMENMGKDGILGIMKTADKPIITTVDNGDNWNNMYNNGIF